MTGTINLTFQLDPSVQVGSTVCNTGNITSSGVDLNLTDNTDNACVQVTGTNLFIQKTLTTAGPFNPGDIITYELAYANTTSGTIQNVEVIDTPSNVTLIGSGTPPYSFLSGASYVRTIGNLTGHTTGIIYLTAMINSGLI